MGWGKSLELCLLLSVLCFWEKQVSWHVKGRENCQFDLQLPSWCGASTSNFILIAGQELWMKAPHLGGLPLWAAGSF